MSATQAKEVFAQVPPLPARRVAVLELGTNSFHLLVAECTEPRRLRTMLHEKRRVQLGEDSFRTGQISPEAFERGVHAVEKLWTALRHARPDSTVAVATSAIRDAANGRLFVGRAERITGLDIQVLPGLEEARLAYLGARQDLEDTEQRVALFDFGGGSTEVVLAEAGHCRYRASLDLGALRLRSEWPCDAPTADDLRRLELEISKRLEPVLGRVAAFQADALVFSCGTARKLLRLAIRELGEDPDAKALTLPRLYELENLLCRATPGERNAMTGNDTQRVDTSVPGVAALRVILERTRADGAIVAKTGLREGLLIDLLDRGA